MTTKKTHITHSLVPSAYSIAGPSSRWHLSLRHHSLVPFGPAIEWASGTKHWYLNGRCHREDGPAIEWADGSKAWYLDGKKLSEAEFNARANQKPSCEGKVVEVDGIKYKLVKA